MQHLYGGPAYTSFQLDKLKRAADIGSLCSAEIFFVHGSVLRPEDMAVLQRVVHASDNPPISDPDLLIVPRLGTISPWSSKATEIVHICGLERIARIERGVALWTENEEARERVAALASDPMTQTVLRAISDAEKLFQRAEPAAVQTTVLGDDPLGALGDANARLGLALSRDEIQYLADNYARLGRNPTDVELLMFSQANSEHCRHKIFNAEWTIDGEKQAESLFAMIRNTHAHSPDGVLSAYSDNAAVIEGYEASRFFPAPESKVYSAHSESVHIAIKVETHNHPTGISPHPGAATGSGGEIRDEGATGRGGKPKAGLAGFSVSDLNIPGHSRPWEDGRQHPDRLATPLQIMIDGPIGAAAFNNEFGRPNLTGYFRTFHHVLSAEKGEERRGYHKPIMIAGGYGSVRPHHVDKKRLPEGAVLVALGGPAMLIGLGGGSASSMATGSQSEALDFASVQRANPEMQRRCQEVIDRCWALGDQNPIESIHDVGAGGLSNAFPELVHDSDRGGIFELRDIPNAEPQLSPMEIWCSEAQERYVIGILDENLKQFAAMCERENAPFAVVGRTTNRDELVLNDRHFQNKPIDMPLSMLLGKPPQMQREASRRSVTSVSFDTGQIRLDEAARRVLQLPTVASKSFLITIGDRTITGLVARDQMVGPWQVPVADVAVTTSSFDSTRGEAMAMGERTPLALLDAAASGRMAIGEAITNIAAAPIGKLGDIKLSANWMVAADHPGEGARLYDTVAAVGLEVCPELGIAIPVGKDSMSMRAKWTDDQGDHQVTAPLSLVVTAFAPVTDATAVLTPELKRDLDTDLWLIDLGHGQNRLGGSALAYVFGALGHQSPNLDDTGALKRFFEAIQRLNEAGQVLAYHDRSDGGLFATVVEMAFAGRTGIELDVSSLGSDPIRALFAEELGAVVQVSGRHRDAFIEAMSAAGLGGSVHRIGAIRADQAVRIQHDDARVFDQDLTTLLGYWTETSHRIQSLRDNPICADEERESMLNPGNSGLFADLRFEPSQAEPFSGRPRVAVLREQGVNGQIEMAAAFDRAGFDAVDVHMNDLRSGTVSLGDFKGLVACGGFSYGDVLGAGGGWAKSILYSPALRAEFAAFFGRDDTFTLGVCNGCQMLSQLKELIPGAAHWPRFVRNQSAQFEARLAQVEVLESPSILLRGMAGSFMPIPVAHGEGYTEFDTPDHAERAETCAAIRYVDCNRNATTHYPENPNGSPQGFTAFTSTDGRVTIMMPHPERAFRTVQFSWCPEEWAEDGPWMQLFRNAREWVGSQPD